MLGFLLLLNLIEYGLNIEFHRLSYNYDATRILEVIFIFYLVFDYTFISIFFKNFVSFI
jgi:hypothetical protein